MAPATQIGMIILEVCMIAWFAITNAKLDRIEKKLDKGSERK